ncbi:efflux RND transporter periplasmic adaptor subunit [Paenibacillus sediminis]|uniref:Macrolide-specific efflux system membrane fusion protein n=1 Tax=Paenibacillus sediminis TaxID=664909 RepID=A0ABS4H027_9BACL|nr:efflux RND transporter periplasmic adaptor subunit [Paenibacillus sediminis]MBP1935485.1 macrolide-specific efflux system membrane fusion protein [Paenibacillus sediminis]
MSTKWWTANLFRKETRARKICLLILCSSLLLTAGCSLLPKENEEEVLPEITAPTISKKPEYEVRKETLETKVSGIGKLMSEREEVLFFTADSLHVQELYVKNGDKVKKGALIAKLDVEDLEKQLRQKKLEMRKLEVQMKETLRTKEDMDPVEYEGAVISFEESRQALTDLENEIAKATLTAPFDGTVVSVNVKKGDQVKAYDPIATVADTTHLLVAASFDKEDLQKVAVGMKADVTIQTVGDFTGKVKVIPTIQDDSNNSDGGGGNQRPNDDSIDKYLIVELDKKPSGLNRGNPLSVSIVTQRKENAILIPLSALRTIGSRTYVQVVDENGKREVDVEVGQQTSTDVEIVKGLTPGQKVVGR